MSWFNNNLVPTIIEQAECILSGMAELPDFPKDSNGGYFSVSDRMTGETLLLIPIGEVTDQNLIRYRGFCLEKVRRLIQNPAHLSSWQSKNKTRERYAGAVLLPGNMVLSFSGLPELADEALCLILAIILDWTSQAYADEIATISTNKIYFEYTKEFIND